MRALFRMAYLAFQAGLGSQEDRKALRALLFRREGEDLARLPLEEAAERLWQEVEGEILDAWEEGLPQVAPGPQPGTYVGWFEEGWERIQTDPAPSKRQALREARKAWLRRVLGEEVA